jgi:hypothetical protein
MPETFENYSIGSWDGSVSTVTDYGLHTWSSFPSRGREFSLPHHIHTDSDPPTQPLIHWVPQALSFWVKQPRHEADHSYPFSWHGA